MAMADCAVRLVFNSPSMALSISPLWESSRSQRTSSPVRAATVLLTSSNAAFGFVLVQPTKASGNAALSSPGCNGGTGDCAACGLAGCDADQSGDSGVLTQPAKTAALQPTVNMVAIGRLIGVYLLRSARPFDREPTTNTPWLAVRTT